MTGAELIATERLRQIEAEGYDSAHDDAHENEELLLAALRFIDAGSVFDFGYHETLPLLPADWKCKPRSRVLQTHDERVRHLVKAGALIAAEIDRVMRAEGLPQGEPPMSEDRPAREGVSQWRP